jgi:hypothetical protein
VSLEDSWAEAVAHYRAGVDDSLLAVYRCRRKGCVLLKVWNAPRGQEFFAPAARIADRNLTARQWHWLGFNRADERHTGDRAGRLDDLARLQAGGWFWLVCEHVKESVWLREIRQDFAGSRPGVPVSIFIPR